MKQEQSLDSFDHRRLGRRLGIFRLDPETGAGLPLWLPKGTIVRDELEKLARELEFRDGFERVVTPHLARATLYRRSGHLPYFEADMFPRMEVAEDRKDLEADPAAEAGARPDSDAQAHGHAATRAGAGVDRSDAYVLRPMNCPHHHRVFAAEPRSHRDLPLRLAEYGQVYRWERSGALSGLARVRGMCMNDGHIYCTKAQVPDEIRRVLSMYREVYTLLGIDRYRFRLSLSDAADPRGKYVDDPDAWDWSERLLAELLESLGIEFERGVGHAAFYGPKIDVQVATLNGGEETLSTVQLDFAQPARLGLRYVDADGRHATPLCVHRAPFSTHERLVACLLERHGGAFPTWLSPVQVSVVAISDRYAAYAREIVARLRERFIRAVLAPFSETVSRNVRDAFDQCVPNIAIVGERERDGGTVTLRRRGRKDQLVLALDEFERRLVEAIRARTPDFRDGG